MFLLHIHLSALILTFAIPLIASALFLLDLSAELISRLFLGDQLIFFQSIDSLANETRLRSTEEIDLLKIIEIFLASACDVLSQCLIQFQFIVDQILHFTLLEAANAFDHRSASMIHSVTCSCKSPSRRRSSLQAFLVDSSVLTESVRRRKVTCPSAPAEMTIESFDGMNI